MKFSACSRTGFALALTAAMVAMASPATAQEQGSSIFSNVSPSIRDRVFFRLNYIHANVKTKSGEAYDVTGPVIGVNDIQTYLAPGNTSGTSQGVGRAAANDGGQYVSPYFPTSGGSASVRAANIYNPSNGVGLNFQLNDAIQQDVAAGFTFEANGLGTPVGIKARSQDSVGTPAISIGYFFTDDYTWSVEGYLLATPLKVTVQGDGVTAQGTPNGINGKDIIKSKLLPPTAVLGYYFGKKQDLFRPFAGIGASYAVFFDTRPTEALNTYQGGRNIDDTSIQLKNSFGVGPFVGLRADAVDGWSLNLSIGKLRYKTEATLVTRNTTINSSTGVIRDFGPYVYVANTDGVDAITSSLAGSANGRASAAYQQGVITALMCDLAAAKYHNNDCNLGTYVRKQSTVLDNTMFMFSVGRTF